MKRTLTGKDIDCDDFAAQLHNLADALEAGEAGAANIEATERAPADSLADATLVLDYHVDHGRSDAIVQFEYEDRGEDAAAE